MKVTVIQQFDFTPTWEDILPAMLAVLENGPSQGSEIVKEELLRMARIADYAVAQSKN